jgi:hypothetical protein
MRSLLRGRVANDGGRTGVGLIEFSVVIDLSLQRLISDELPDFAARLPLVVAASMLSAMNLRSLVVMAVPTHGR